LLDVGFSVAGVVSPIPGTGLALKGGRTAAATDATFSVYKGSKLARDMARSGNPVEKGIEQAHHIVAKNDGRAAAAKSILNAHGIDLDSAVNGARVANDAHRRLHTTAYYLQLENRLHAANHGAKAEQRVRKVLDEYREMLQLPR